MGWFSGNTAQVNRDTRQRASEAKGLMLDIGMMAKKYSADTQQILSEMTSAQMREASKAREASVAATETRNRRALEEGLAASSDPLVQADVAGAAGADRSVTETIRARGKIEQGILARETQQRMQVEDVAKASEMASKLGTANILGSVDEAVDQGAEADVMSLLGIVAGANMDKITGWFKSDPMSNLAPGSESLGELPEVKETLVAGVDRPIEDSPVAPELAPSVSPIDPLAGTAMNLLGTPKKSLLDLMPSDRRKAYMERHGISPSLPLMQRQMRPLGVF